MDYAELYSSYFTPFMQQKLLMTNRAQRDLTPTKYDTQNINLNGV